MSKPEETNPQVRVEAFDLRTTTIEDIICKTAIGRVTYERRPDEPPMLETTERIIKGIERHTRAVSRLAPNLTEVQWDRLAIAIRKHTGMEIAPEDLRAMQWKDYIRLLEVAADEAEADAQRLVRMLRQTLPSAIVDEAYRRAQQQPRLITKSVALQRFKVSDATLRREHGESLTPHRGKGNRLMFDQRELADIYPQRK